MDTWRRRAGRQVVVGVEVGVGVRGIGEVEKIALPGSAIYINRLPHTGPQA